MSQPARFHHRVLASDRGEYAVRVLMDLARASLAVPVTAAHLAERQRVPLRLLPRLLRDLSRAGLVQGDARRGPSLARRPEEITLASVLSGTEGPFEIVNCRRGAQRLSRRHGTCLTRKIWERVDRDLNTALARITLREMLRLEAEQSVWGDLRVPAGPLMRSEGVRR